LVVDSANCSKKGALVGGLKFGENFQYKRLFWGVGADLDYWGSKTTNQSFTFAGAAPPPGKYTFSNSQNPREFAVVGPRIGYAGDTWLPYVLVGGILGAGGHDGELFYSASGSTKTTASFSGGKDFSTAGWAAGGGFELGLNGAWSISAEYLHANLGKGSDSSAVCSGAARACAAFSGLSLESTHGSFSANIFRVGIVYYFSYWDI
jgi:opacity protein-like surface antigen